MDKKAAKPVKMFNTACGLVGRIRSYKTSFTEGGHGSDPETHRPFLREKKEF